MNASDPFRRDVQGGVFVLGKERHQLTNRAFQLLVKRSKLIPRNIAGSVPVARGRLFVELGCSFAPGLIPVEDIERKVRAAFLDSRATRRESIRLFCRALDLSSVPQKPIPCIEAS